MVTSSLHPSAPGLIDGGVGEGSENLVLTSQCCSLSLCSLNVFTDGLQSFADGSRLTLPEAAVNLREILLRWFLF